MLLTNWKYTIIFYCFNFTLRMNVHGIFGMLSKGLEPVFHGAEGKGISVERRIILRRRRSRSIPRGTLILFSGPAILRRSRGTPRVETRSWNAYSSRRIFRTMPSSTGRRNTGSPNQRRFRFLVPRGYEGHMTSPAFPAVAVRSHWY